MQTFQMSSVLSQLLQQSLANFLKDCRQSTLWVANTDQMPISEITLYETATDIVLTANLADVEIETLRVQVSQETILIQGQYSQSTAVEGYFAPSSFQSLIPLPCSVHPETVHAERQPGVLMVRFPKSAQILPARVEVELPCADRVSAQLHTSAANIIPDHPISQT